MPKLKRSLNTIYISERMQEQLRRISQTAFTVVVAPMGYGKSTAINWYINGLDDKKNKVIRINIYSDSIPLFWNSVKNAFKVIDNEIDAFQYPSDIESRIILTEHMRSAFDKLNEELYIFIDDFHLMKDASAVSFICSLAYSLPENIHIIVASRDRFLPAGEVMHFGKNLHKITAEHLKLNYTEINIYAKNCGINLENEQLERLVKLSEGWFSAVYLNLRSYIQYGEMLEDNDDIYESIMAALIETASDEEKQFLFKMSIADEFSVKMAKFITENDKSENLLKSMTEKNAFITRMPDKNYRFHHMLKHCANEGFDSFNEEEKKKCYTLYGKYYENNNEYFKAFIFFDKAEDYDGWLRTVQKDVGVDLAVTEPKEVLRVIEKCSVEKICQNPWSALVLMRRLFTWRQIPKMLEIKNMLTEYVKTNTELSETEKGDILGECDLIMSFLCYNDIAAMSRLHRSASKLMSKSAVSIRTYGSWTFGSPSVLMMFHREKGNLQNELDAMNESMPYYYKVTEGHGQGAELLMQAEAYFMQGDIIKAYIELEKARQRVKENCQINMDLCCDFLALRLSLHTDKVKLFDFDKRKTETFNTHNTLFVNIYQSILAYYFALMGETDKIPDEFREHKLDGINYLAPCKPMMYLIENQVYLIQNEFAKVIGRSDSLIAQCRAVPYNLCEIHILIQTAAAYEKINCRKEAEEYFEKAVELSVPDKLYMPFVENYVYIKDLIKGRNFDKNIKEIAENSQKITEKIKIKSLGIAELKCLTPKEAEIASLMAKRLTGKEIAERLFLSEGTIKQYINRIYGKLSIEGDTKTKRRKLYELFEK